MPRIAFALAAAGLTFSTTLALAEDSDFDPVRLQFEVLGLTESSAAWTMAGLLGRQTRPLAILTADQAAARFFPVTITEPSTG